MGVLTVYGGTTQYRARPPAGTTRKDWWADLKRVLGSTSPYFVDACLRRLIAACTMPGEAIPTTTSVSAALALIVSLKPANELEATMAVRIACLDAASGNLLSRLSRGGTESRTKVTTNAIGKIERALNAAINTYYRIKHGQLQTIRIERLEIQSGARAVVGHVAAR